VIQFVVDQGVKRSIEITRLINEAKAEFAPPGEAASADGTAEEEVSDT
jgi:hypothetical protein